MMFLGDTIGNQWSSRSCVQPILSRRYWQLYIFFPPSSPLGSFSLLSNSPSNACLTCSRSLMHHDDLCSALCERTRMVERRCSARTFKRCNKWNKTQKQPHHTRFPSTLQKRKGKNSKELSGTYRRCRKSHVCSHVRLGFPNSQFGNRWWALLKPLELREMNSICEKGGSALGFYFFFGLRLSS